MIKITMRPVPAENNINQHTRLKRKKKNNKTLLKLLLLLLVLNTLV